MKDKRPIDRVREAGGMMDVGTPDDQTPVTDLFSIGDTLCVIKEKGIYEIKFADAVDPKRTNIAVPNTQQRILNHGSDEPLVGRILLTAKELFNPSYLPKGFDHTAALRLSFEILKDIAAMHDMAVAMTEEEAAAVSFIEDRRKKDRSFVLPAIANVEVRCNEFIQKADHALQSLLSIVKLFYGKDAAKQWFESLRDLAVHRYGEDDHFSRLLTDILPSLKFVRGARNSVEHPDEGKHLVVKDFTLKPDLSVTPPTIEIVHPHSPQPEMSVSQFMKELTDHLMDIVEWMMAGLVSKHIQECPGLNIQVVEFTQDTAPAKHVRFGIGFYQGDRPVRAS